LGFEPVSALISDKQRQAEPFALSDANSDRDARLPRRDTLPALLGVMVVALGAALSFIIFW
jgi:hypothetical protein